MRFRAFAAVAPLILGLALTTAFAADDKPAAPTDKAAAGTEAPKPEKQKRHSVKKATTPVTPSAWSVGFAYGMGSVEQKVEGKRFDREIGPSANVRLTYAVKPNVSVGAEMSQWESAPDSSTWTFRGIMPSVTIRADQGKLKGGWVRFAAGGGVMRSRFTALQNSPATVVPAYVDTLRYEVSDDGFAAALGLGYEWRWGKRLGIGPMAEITYINAGPGRSANFANVSLNLNWYW